MSGRSKRYLISFSHDITKIRNEISTNLELLQMEEGQKDFVERMGKLPEDFQKAFLAISFFGVLMAFHEDSRKELAELIENLKYCFEQRPFDIHYSLIGLTEFLFFLENPNEVEYERINELGYAVKKNELLKREDDASLDVFKVGEPIDQENKNYSLYFAFTLRQISVLKIDQFLDHQLSIYQGNFKSFLENLLIEYEEVGLFLTKTQKAVKKWLENNQFTQELISKVGTHLSDDMKMKIVIDELEWLNPSMLDTEKIIFQKDYNRLLKYIKVLVVENKLPDGIKPITGISFIGFGKKMRLSFYKIHTSILGTRRINDKYIDFLHKVFPYQFTGEQSTTKKKFSSK